MKILASAFADDVVACHAGSHPVMSVIARNEPERQRLRALADLERAIPSYEALAECGASIVSLATTPDFHPGRPVPIGVVARVRGAVLPHLVGNDIGCGMRLMVLEGLTAEDVDACTALDQNLRHVLFQGGRDVALTGRMRRALLEEGLLGFLEAVRHDRPQGLLATLDVNSSIAELDRSCDLGSLTACGIEPGFEAYVSLNDDIRRDAILGSLGGGNHFLEIGVIDQIADGIFARIAGIKTGSVMLCIHSGSLDFGQCVGTIMADTLHLRRNLQADNRILSLDDPLARRYLTGLANAGNAAFGNRFFLCLAAVEALRRATGRDVMPRLVYDAPHNMAWPEGGEILHRKGACPARNGAAMAGSPYAYYGEPVILPGSMGDGTWLLSGRGCAVTDASSAHGAGRRLPRSRARREGIADIEKAKLRVIGPIDLAAPQLQGRQDILNNARAQLAEEAPRAYRPIDMVVEPLVGAGLVGRVAKIRPIVTAKG